MIHLSVWRVFGIFSTILIISLFFGGTILGIARAIKEGDSMKVLSESGGRIFLLDNALLEETDYLLEESAKEDSKTFELTFHLIYAFSILFIFFFIALLLFKFGNWLSGKAQWSPGTDVLVIFLVIALLFILQFLYSIFFLDRKIYPMQGIYTFAKNLPQILKNLI